NDHQLYECEARIESFHTAILNQNLWWHDWDECVRGIRCMPRLVYWTTAAAFVLGLLFTG
ncbi:MAG: hypothetical protein QF661_13395, partial [Arenicellales bacterium]|nr:hypothetical protein [Arenicellales bacterium]